MTKHTLSNKTRYSILKLSGFRARMSNSQGQKTIRNRRKKRRNNLAPRY
jgi:ribosomal protein L34